MLNQIVTNSDLCAEYENLKNFEASADISIFQKTLTESEAEKEIIFYGMAEDNPSLMPLYLDRENKLKNFYKALFKFNPMLFVEDKKHICKFDSEVKYHSLVESSIREKDFLTILIEQYGVVIQGTHDLELVSFFLRRDDVFRFKHIVNSAGLFFREIKINESSGL